jgi:hypothetical protein
MSRISIGLLLSLTLLMAGCGYGNHYMGANGAPNIMTLSPNTKTHGDPDFTLTVTGSGFGTDAVVFFNGTALPSRYSNGSTVMAQVSAADVVNAGAVPVFVQSGGKSSNIIDLTVQ